MAECKEHWLHKRSLPSTHILHNRGRDLLSRIQEPQPSDTAAIPAHWWWCRKISAGSCCDHLTSCRHWGRSQQQGLPAGMLWDDKWAQANKPGPMTCPWHCGSTCCSRGMKEACGSPRWHGDGRSNVYLRSTWDPTGWQKQCENSECSLGLLLAGAIFYIIL